MLNQLENKINRRPNYSWSKRNYLHLNKSLPISLLDQKHQIAAVTNLFRIS
ncbi:hypothetical protein BY996DRAFT_6449162 [Phakopsora pachyrhizi]|nr:hypothetical protein BY996DRAFT_6449162 [Phakopsora pachyrhizi]